MSVSGRQVRIASAAARDCARHRARAGRSQAPGSRPVDGRAEQRDALDPAAAGDASASSRARGEREAAQPYFDRLRVKSPRLDTLVAALSGGNQQKIVLTKWLAARCPILILDEPTRGVDVGAKAEIHALIDELAAAGNAIILISSEMPEVLNLSTRILVFRAGRIVGELSRAEASQEVADAADGGGGRVGRGSGSDSGSEELRASRCFRARARVPTQRYLPVNTGVLLPRLDSPS